jgi:hypothetical protein
MSEFPQHHIPPNSVQVGKTRQQSVTEVPNPSPQIQLLAYLIGLLLAAFLIYIWIIEPQKSGRKDYSEGYTIFLIFIIILVF